MPLGKAGDDREARLVSGLRAIFGLAAAGQCRVRADDLLGALIEGQARSG